MAWTTPRTWVASEVVTAAIMNSGVRDNSRYLKGLDGDITLEANVLTAFNVDGVDVSSHESRHVSGGADDIDSALAIAAMPNLTQDKVWKGNVSNRPTEVAFPTRTLSAANETVQEGYYAATTLSAVDADLAIGNIKKDIVIFGFTGTHKDLIDYAVNADLSMFQGWDALGDLTNVAALNDNDTGSETFASIVTRYGEITFGDLVKIQRWRQYGKTSNNGDGVWKIQYWNIETDAFVDWVTGIATRAAASWSSFSTETIVVTTKIRWVATTIDGSGSSSVMEIEVIY